MGHLGMNTGGQGRELASRFPKYERTLEVPSNPKLYERVALQKDARRAGMYAALSSSLDV